MSYLDAQTCGIADMTTQRPPLKTDHDLSAATRPARPSQGRKRLVPPPSRDLPDLPVHAAMTAFFMSANDDRRRAGAATSSVFSSSFSSGGSTTSSRFATSSCVSTLLLALQPMMSFATVCNRCLFDARD